MEAPDFLIAVADLWEKKLLVGMPVWENGRLKPADLEELIQNMHLLPQARSEEWRVGLIVFGRRPFTAEIQAATAVIGVRLVTLVEIEPLLLVAREVRRREPNSPASEPFEF